MDVDENRNLRFNGSIAPDVFLELTGDRILTLTSTKAQNTKAERSIGLVCDQDTGHIKAVELTQGRFEVIQWSSDGEHSEHLKRFTAQWLPFFRRGCWLSGYPIEASAHEKAEWMQAFTHEEIKAWYLKF